MSILDFTIAGEVNVQVTVTALDNGDLQFDIEVLDTNGQIGDLNGLFFDFFGDDSFNSGLSISGDDVTKTVINEDSVNKVDSYNNLNGEVVKDLGRFDLGVQFGTSGISNDDIRSTSFVLSHDTMDLTLDMIASQDFGARLTSVGTLDGSRDGSLKLGTTAPEVGTEIIANDDLIDVLEDNEFGDSNFFEFINDGNDLNILGNDSNDGGVYTGSVIAVNGSADNVGQIVAGSNGGYMIINADGSTDFTAFDAAGINEFAYLAQFEFAETTFDYTIEGGDTATITVSVSGLDELDPGDPTDPTDPTDPWIIG